MQHFKAKMQNFEFCWASQTRFLDPAEGAYMQHSLS